MAALLGERRSGGLAATGWPQRDDALPAKHADRSNDLIQRPGQAARDLCDRPAATAPVDDLALQGRQATLGISTGPAPQLCPLLIETEVRWTLLWGPREGPVKLDERRPSVVLQAASKACCGCRGGHVGDAEASSKLQAGGWSVMSTAFAGRRPVIPARHTVIGARSSSA
jgi:hypothetical protein